MHLLQKKQTPKISWIFAISFNSEVIFDILVVSSIEERGLFPCMVLPALYLVHYLLLFEQKLPYVRRRRVWKYDGEKYSRTVL